jgi:AhpD family alkylhydroperoxidase
LDGGPAQNARIAPGGRHELGVPLWVLAQIAGRVARTEPPKLFTTLGRHRRLFRGWLGFARRLMPGGRLPRRETELVILRVAHLRRCAYEHEHHVRLARRAGLDDADLARVQAGPGAAGWSAREAAMLRLVEELHERGGCDDETWAAARAHLGETELIELVMLAAHYEMLATVIGTLRIGPDRRAR